jgi:hypothetical protein
VLNNGCENWTVILSDKGKNYTSEMKLLRSEAGFTLLDVNGSTETY